MKRRWNQTLATPGPEWAAPIPAAPAGLSSRKIKPWAKEKARTQPARHDRSSQWHRWIQTTTMQIPQVGVDSETHKHRNKTQEKCAKNARGRLCWVGTTSYVNFSAANSGILQPMGTTLSVPCIMCNTCATQCATRALFQKNH